MGILNLTPDSFSDGGRFVDADNALRHALAMAQSGADILDVGGESTRPGADKVTLQEELDRVIPVIERIASETATPISVDTCKPAVMRPAVAAGATMINDVNGLRAEGAMELVAELEVPACIMHMQGTPQTMQQDPRYDQVVDEVIMFLQTRVQHAKQHGIPNNMLIVDPGIGFGKTLEHNLALLAKIPLLRATTGCDVLIGVSRKSLIDHLLSRSVDERLPASLGLAVQAALNGAKILRVHDVQATHDAVRAAEAVSQYLERNEQTTP